MTDRAALMLTIQSPLVSVHAPLQPSKSEPATGSAFNVTEVLSSKMTEQLAAAVNPGRQAGHFTGAGPRQTNAQLVGGQDADIDRDRVGGGTIRYLHDETVWADVVGRRGVDDGPGAARTHRVSRAMRGRGSQAPGERG